MPQAKSIEEAHFVRDLLSDRRRPLWRQYAAFVVGGESLRVLLQYEIRTFFFHSTPGALGYALRRRSYRRLFKRVGRGLILGRNVVIRHADKITLGDNVSIDDDCVIDGRGAGEDGLVIEDNVIIGRGTIVQSKLGGIRIGANCNVGAYSVVISQGDRIDIEDWCQIAGGCKISGGRFKLDPNATDGSPLERESAGPISIGRASFLGMGVIVADGAVIGAHCAVGPGAVIAHPVPAHAVVMARPAVVVGSVQPKHSDVGDGTRSTPRSL